MKDLDEIIEKFYSLKKEVDSLLKGYSKGTHLQNYLYFTYAPVFNYTESMIILCNAGKSNAASSLFRSLVEAHINSIYHQVNDSEKRLAISAKDRFDQLEKAFSSIYSFIKKYPSQNSPDKKNLFNEEYLNGALAYIKSTKDNIVKSNNISDGDKKIGLADMAIKNDQAKVSNAPEGHFEKMYHLIYRQLSPSVHLDVLGLESFTDNINGEYTFIERWNKEVLITQAVDICIALVKDLFENKVINGNIPPLVNDIERKLKTSSEEN